MRRQIGLTMTGFLVTAAILVIVALLALKIGPAYMEYYSIQKQLKLVANDMNASSSRREIELAFERRADVENITAINARDIEITKDGDQLVLSANYSVKVPLVGNLSAYMDFNASSEK